MEYGADGSGLGGPAPAERAAARTAENDTPPAAGNGGFAERAEPETQPASAPAGEAADKDGARKGWLSRFLD
jgi:hypothetical protein